MLALLIIGFATAVLSAALAVWAYLAHRVAVGLHPNQIEGILGLDVDPGVLREELISGYVKAIASNFLVLDRSTKRFRLALISWIASIASLSTGALGLFVITAT